MRVKYDHLEIKRRLAFLDLMAQEGIDMRRSGANWTARCPFHEEGSGSFTVHGSDDDHAHCYGCGWHGDIFDFWIARHGGGFSDAVAALASLLSLSPSHFEAKRQQAAKMPRMSDVAGKQKEKPPLPRLRKMSDEEIRTLAALRDLSIEGIEAAVADKRVAVCLWPQFIDYRGAWRDVEGAALSWVVTDSTRNVAQFRRLDGVKYERKEGKSIKAWTKGSPTWPLGAAEMGDRAAVLLVEGGADMLAAYHFLKMFQRLKSVAVCAMLGASCAINGQALPYFVRKRVRIIMDVDEPDRKTGMVPSFEAAARWTKQLTQAGAAVETFSLADLARKDGTPIKDLNDLVYMDESAWLDDELRQAFFDFDF